MLQVHVLPLLMTIQSELFFSQEALSGGLKSPSDIQQDYDTSVALSSTTLSSASLPATCAVPSAT